MSGIFGIIRLPGASVVDAELAPMADTLKHRGPDGINYFARGNVGLGHCMLQSTPESLHETLPLRDEAAGLTITADARIDNRERLITDIPVRAASGHVITDSQLILHAYIKWGEACVDHLLGDFAFAIWDERAQSLFVARDHMGCKPFYYHCRDGLLVFASSAMAVARVPDVKATLNEGRVADYLVQELEGINKTCSWFNEISRMPPAHCGYFRNNRFQCRQYWVLEPTDLSHLKTDEDYLEAFTEVYFEAVRCRLRCQTEPASMLSGGLDSSTIVALARDILVAEGKPPLRTYSAVSEKGVDCPETHSVEAIITQGNLTARCLRPIDTDQHISDLNVAMSSLEDPFDSTSIMSALINLCAAKDGGVMLLTGLDGESAVGAPTNYIAYMLRRGHFCAAWCEARGFSKHYYRGYYSALTLYAKAIRSRLVPNFLRSIKGKMSHPLSYWKLILARRISPLFARKVNLSARILEERSTNALGLYVDPKAWHKNAMQVAYLTAGIERYERLASYAGLQARHPLLDVRLLAFSAELPLNQKVRGGWSKYMLRRIANERLPLDVAWREGWEQLGWKFIARRAQQFELSENYPQRSLREKLSPLVDVSIFEDCRSVVDHDKDYGKLLDRWILYCLYKWL